MNRWTTQDLIDRGYTADGKVVTPNMPETMASLRNILRPEKTYLGITLESDCVLPESEFQAGVFAWFRSQGYRGRTKKEILAEGPCAGWFVHLNEAQGNPLILDALVFASDYSWICELEFKTVTGRPTKEQAALIARGGKLCRTLEEVKSAIEEAKGRAGKCTSN